MAYKINPSTGMLTRLNEQSSEGKGPCHVSIDPKGRFAYVSNYGNGSLAVYPINKNGSLGQAIDVVQHKGSSANPERQQGPHMHSIIPSTNGKFIYASNRGHDSLVIYEVNAATGKLTLVGFEDTHGAHPRNFCVDEKGKYLFVANRDNDNVVVFQRNQTSGKLTYLREVKVPMAVCIKQLSLH